MNALLGYDLLFDNVNALLQRHKITDCTSYLVTISHAIYHLTHAEGGDGSSFADYTLISQETSKAEIYAHFLRDDSPQKQQYDGGIIITDMGDNVEITVQYNSVESLKQPVKQEAIRLAKDILDKLRIQFAGASLDGVLKSDDLFAIKDLMEGVEKVGRVFKHHLEQASRMNARLLEDEDVEAAQKALAVFRYASAKEMVNTLQVQLLAAKEGGNIAESHALMERISKTKADMSTLPEEAKGASHHSIKELLDVVETGMDKLTQKMQEMGQAGKDAAGSARSLGNEDAASKQAEQGKKPTMDLSQKQNELQQQQQQVVIQRAADAVRTERAEKTAQTAQATQQSKQSQQAQQEQQQRREQRQERQERQAQQQAQQQRQQQRQAQAQQQQQQQEQRANRSIERNIRQLREAQIQQRQEQQQQAPKAASKIPAAAPPSPQGQKTAMPMEAIQSLQQSMAGMQQMEVPDALKPNSPARMIKSIQQQRDREQASPAAPAPQELPFNVKPNNNEVSR